MNITAWKEIAGRLNSRQPAAGLLPETVWDSELDARIQSLETGGDSYAECCKSGLLLWNDNLDGSHSLSQNIHHATGSYWHGIMHRREGDFSNAKYWFRQVGRHEVFHTLHERSAGYLGTLKQVIEPLPDGRVKRLLLQAASQSAWDPYLFVDLAEAQLRQGPAEAEPWLRELQRLEFALLLQYSFDRCYGGQILEQIDS